MVSTRLSTAYTRMSVITRQSSNALAASAFSGSTSRSAGASGSMSKESDELNATQTIFLLDLPMEILDKILSYVGYKKVGQIRVVSRQMNQVCSAILNSTFTKLQTQMLNRFQLIKTKMPRRESARRNHPLACECDIIETCYMRLSLLQMTFGKHIERKHCCFFPGGILDEVYNILSYLRTTTRLERPFQVTDELFDLSTMAMEYFTEYIQPNLPEIAYFPKDKPSFSMKATAKLVDSSSSISSPPQSNMVLRKGIRKIKQGMKMYNNQLTALKSELRTCKRKSSEQGKQIAEQQKLLAEQQKQTMEYANRLDENDKKNEEMSRKFSTLLQELNKCKTELQYWRSKSPAVHVCTSCGYKVAPVVAPEEYQALLNQGVKPEDININLDEIEDGDTSRNKNDNYIEENCPNTEFAFPNEVATDKLSITSSTRGLGSKRRHDGAAKTATISSSNSKSVSILADDSIVKHLDHSNEPNLIKNDIIKPSNINAGNGGDGSNEKELIPVDPLMQLSMMNSCSDANGTSVSISSLSHSISSDFKKARKVQNKGRCHNMNSKRNK